jgi:hypothetical protein
MKSSLFIYSPENAIIMKFHVCVGTSFVAAFVDEFRKQSRVFEQRLQKQLDDTPNLLMSFFLNLNSLILKTYLLFIVIY